MSQAPGSPPPSESVPAWISAGVIGIAIGAGAGIVGMQIVRPETPKAAAAASAPGGQAPAAPAMGGPPMMGMGGGGMGGMGGGGGGGGKRALTSLVGKLELLSRPDLKLHVDLDETQAKAIAEKLVAFEKSESMSGDDAQKNLEELEAILTAEQKDVLAQIGLPFGRGGGGGGRGGPGGGGGAGGAPAGGGPGAGGAPGGGGPGAGHSSATPPSAPPGGMGGGMGMGGGGGNPNENPFTQEANQKRLRDLLGRIAPGLPEPAEKPQ